MCLKYGITSHTPQCVSLYVILCVSAAAKTQNLDTQMLPIEILWSERQKFLVCDSDGRQNKETYVYAEGRI